MYKLNWSAGPDGNTLCAVGRPIRIRRGGDIAPFMLECDGHITLPYWALAAAKLDAERFADQMDEFCPPDNAA